VAMKDQHLTIFLTDTSFQQCTTSALIFSWNCR